MDENHENNESHKVLFTDPTDPTWTLVDFVGKTLVLHACADSDHYTYKRRLEDCSEDACGYCTQEPPPGFIALYKLYTWDK